MCLDLSKEVVTWSVSTSLLGNGVQKDKHEKHLGGWYNGPKENYDGTDEGREGWQNPLDIQDAVLMGTNTEMKMRKGNLRNDSQFSHLRKQMN